VKKDLRIIGLGESILRYIKMDEKLRMNSEELQIQIEKDLKENLFPFCVIGSAGTTNSGSIDPLEEIGKNLSKIQYLVSC